MFNQVKGQRLAIALALTGLMSLMTGCGSQPVNGVVTPPAALAPGAPGSPAACIPLTAAIGFAGQNAYYTGTTIKAGTMPPGYDKLANIGSGAPTGTVVLTTTAVTGTFSTISNPTTEPDGSVTMNIIPGPTAVNGATSSNISGVVTIAQDRLNMIQQYGANGLDPLKFPINTPTFAAPTVATPITSVCVRGLAISMSVKGNTLYLGSVTLDTTLGIMPLYF